MHRTKSKMFFGGHPPQALKLGEKADGRSAGWGAPSSA
jgi:hypothetical protein